VGWSIGEMALRSGLTRDTLRYYEKIGLMVRVARDSGGRRSYGRRDFERLRFIQRARNMDFTLDQIARLLELRDGAATCRTQARRLAREKLEAVNERLTELGLLRDELSGLIERCEVEPGSHCPILDSIAEGKRKLSSHRGT